MKTILVPLDGSALADRAVPFAAAIAKKAGWSLLLLRAIDSMRAPTETALRTMREEAQAALGAAAARIATAGLSTTTRVVDGQPETAILTAAADEDVSLIVMSTHGRGGIGRWIYGSVADTVLRHAPVPVVTVPPHGLDAWPEDQPVKILVPLDGSLLSRAAIEPACQMADILGGSIILGSVVMFPHYAAYAEGYAFVDPDPNDNILMEVRQELEAQAARIRTETLPVEVCATYGSPYFGIMTIARDLGAGMVVMATHGRGGMSRALLGSVATATIRQSDVPIMLIRPDEAELVEPAAGQPVASAETPATPEAPAAAETPAPEPTIDLEVTPEELEILVRAVGERFYHEPIDPRMAEPARALLEKLRTARPATAGSGTTAPTTR